ncbi:MAG: hypothetical protein J1F13_00605 [Prevotellaceae bacterium]|nr:hypothetical protein [Prevotellaceae bacterium]
MNRFIYTLLLSIMAHPLLAQVKTATLEYWFDRNFADRQSTNINGSIEKEVDISSLRNGLHSLELRVSDTNGKWSSPQLRYFIKDVPIPANTHLNTLEYWLDRNFAARQSMNIDGDAEQELDISSLRDGLHSLELRVSDTNDKWSSTLLKYFIKNDPTPAKSVISSYTYWIDDYNNVQTGTIASDNLMLDIDVSALTKGLHSLGYQVQYNTGKKSSPRLLYFIIPDLEQGAGLISTYEYWFNHGARTRVELPDPAPAVSLSDLIIEIRDVLPNSVDGYTFDAATEQASVDDNVTFGVQVYNADDRGSLAAVSETFPMVVPIELNMETLSPNRQPLTTAAPTTGRMQGFKSETAAGDSLRYLLTPENVVADFYDAEGNRISAEREANEDGSVTYTLEATSDCTYMLVYGASDVQTELTATLLSSTPTGLHSAQQGEALSGVHYNTSGQRIDAKQRGVHIVKMSDGTVRKVVVR